MAENTEKIKELETQLAKAVTDATAKDSEIATLKADLKKAQDAQTASQTQIDELKKSIPAKPEDIWKNVDPGVKEQFEAMQKSLADATEKQEMAEIAKKVDTDFKGLPGKSDENATLLRQITKKLSAEETAKLYEMLKSAATLISKSALLSENGNRGIDATGKPSNKFMAAVDEAVAKGQAKNKDEAYTFVAKSQPDLYNEHISDMRKGVK